jgi:hypothetical protein
MKSEQEVVVSLAVLNGSEAAAIATLTLAFGQTAATVFEYSPPLI